MSLEIQNTIYGLNVWVISYLLLSYFLHKYQKFRKFDEYKVCMPHMDMCVNYNGLFSI